VVEKLSGTAEEAQTISKTIVCLNEVKIPGVYVGQQYLKPITMKKLISILLATFEEPKELGELGLTRGEIKEIENMGYVNFRKVVYPTKVGRELARWLLNLVKSNSEQEEFILALQITISKMRRRGNKSPGTLKKLTPLHIHVLQKIKNGDDYLATTIEKRVVKDLKKMELIKEIGVAGFIRPTRLGEELLSAFREASTEIQSMTFKGETQEVTELKDCKDH
jgi:hypothetical protein